MVIGFSGFVSQVVHNQSVEITKEIRQCFDSSKTRLLPTGEKIQIRNNTIYKPVRAKDAWRRKYRRHKAQGSCGFFSPIAEPYETFGKLELDLRKLVVKTLGQKTFQQPKAENQEKRSTWTKLRNNPQILKSNDNESNKSAKGKEPSSANKNMTLVIGEKLSSMKDRVVAVRAGQSYEECLRMECRRKRLEILEEHKNEMHLTLNHAPSFIRKKSVLASRKSLPNSEEAVGLEEARKLDVTELQEYHHRKCKRFTALLRALYSLMCSVYNLKTRDLRTKVPLSRDYLKVINQEVTIDSKGKPVRQQKITNTSHHMSGSTDSFHIRGSDWDRVTCTSNGAGINDSLPNVCRPPAMESGSNLEKQVIGFGTKRFKNVIARPAIEDSSEAPNSQENPSNRSGVSRSSFQTTFNSIASSVKARRGHFLGMLTSTGNTGELPIWQQIAANEKNDKRSRPGSIASTNRKMDKQNKTGLVNELKDEFWEAQKRCSKRLSEDMSRIEKLEKHSFRRKLKALKVDHLLVHDVVTMRRSMNKMIQEYQDEHIRPGWVDFLWDQAQELDVEDDYDVDYLMQKIAPFSKDDVASFSHVKSKLCLIVQSLPLFELCQLHVQEAIKFFLETILGSPNSTLADWMVQRKIKLSIE